MLIVFSLVVLFVLVVAAHARRPARAADHRRRLDASSSATRTPPTSTCARTDRPQPVDAARGHRRRARHPGVRPRARADPAVRRVEPQRCTTRTCTASRCRTWYFGLVEFVRRASPRRWSSASAAGWCTAATSSVGTVARRRAAARPACSSRCSSSSQLYNTVQSAGAALDKLFGMLDTEPDVVERATRSSCRPPATSSSTASTFRYPADRRAGAHRRVARRSAAASGSRSSARPVPASRRSPS